MIFITGATGFLGKHLLPLLAKEGFELTCLIKKGNQNIEFWRKCNIGIKEGDLTEKEYLKKLPQGIDMVIHMAAIIYSKNKNDFYKINFEGAKNLIDECVKRKIKHFVFLSSLNVLHNNSDDYVKSKIMAEDYLKNSGLNYTILRPSLVYGENDNKNIGHLINIIKKSPIVPIIGSGKNKIQPIYVKDIVNCINAILKNPNKFVNRTYALVGSETISLDKMIDLISQKLNLRRWKFHVPLFLIFPVVTIYEYFASHPKINKSQMKNSTRELIVPIDWPNEFNINPMHITEGIRQTINNS